MRGPDRRYFTPPVETTVRQSRSRSAVMHPTKKMRVSGNSMWFDWRSLSAIFSDTEVGDRSLQ